MPSTLMAVFLSCLAPALGYGARRGSGGGEFPPLTAGKPFPPHIPRMDATQKASFQRTAAAAPSRSSVATVALLAHVDSPPFRSALNACCSSIANQSAVRLVDRLRAGFAAAELVHNFDGNFEEDATIEIGLENATEYFPSTWELRWLGYYGAKFNPRWGTPASPEGVSEEGIFLLPRFRGPYDEPTTYEAASSRLLYIALNTLRIDLGNPYFGNVSAIFSPSFWRDSVVAAPLDTGLWTMCCNTSYAAHGGKHHVPCQLLRINCSLGVPYPGVGGHLDHVILHHALYWLRPPGPSQADGYDTLIRYFARSYGDATPNITTFDTNVYVEPNILANALYSQDALKLLVGSFAALFGTPRGKLLQDWARKQGVALAWAVGAALISASPPAHGGASTFAGTLRILDVPSTASKGLLNVGASAADAAAFELLWKEMAEARQAAPGGHVPQSVIWELWWRTRATLSPRLQLDVPRAGECNDEWEQCLGSTGDQSDSSDCACYSKPRWAQTVPPEEAKAD